jgi:predicted N-formylglutamate amidohydrolase
LSDLLGPGDPPPVEVLNPDGRAPFLMTCDHAGRAVPKALGRLGLDDGVFERHVAWDIGAAAVARRLSAALDAPTVFSAYSRLVIDCNRAPGHRGSIPRESDGVRVPGNAKLSPKDVERRRREIFAPYHAAIERLIRARLDAGRPLAVLAVHSFTPEMAGEKRRWHVGVLWDEDARLARPLLAALRADPTLCVGENEPYSARRRQGYGLHVHAADHGLPGVLLEIRQNLIADESGQAAWAERLGAILPGALEEAGVRR